MLGLGFTAKIAGFEPLHLRRGAKTIPGILVGALILFALSGLINILIGRGLITLGITGPTETTSGLEFFQEFSLTEIFFMLLGGAGIAEEVIFRLFVMTGLWCLLKRPSLAILTSAVVFGLYHLSPLDFLYLTFWEYPIYQYVITFLFGLAAAWIYQKKGLEAAILGHTLGDFVGAVMMKLSL
jgi:membrane protease YdiL (CAAX protease family)